MGEGYKINLREYKDWYWSVVTLCLDGLSALLQLPVRYVRSALIRLRRHPARPHLPKRRRLRDAWRQLRKLSALRRLVLTWLRYLYKPQRRLGRARLQEEQ